MATTHKAITGALFGAFSTESNCWRLGQPISGCKSMFHQHHLLRYFARWTPYKPQPKPKLHQKLRTIKCIRSHIENSCLVSPFPCHGFSANQFKPLKNPLPSDPSAAKTVVVKNSLVSKALTGTKFESLGPCLKGMNSLLFVKKEEVMGAALGGVKSAVKEKKMEFNEFTGAVMDGQLYGHLDLEVLENMPSKPEVNAMLLGSIFGPSSTFMAVVEGIGTDEKGDAGVEKGDAGVDGITENENKGSGDSSAH